jgi:hypothetical protein
VVKPRYSNAWNGETVLRDLGVAYVQGPDALAAAVWPRRQFGTWPLLQRHVPGAGRGVFALCDRGRPLGWFAHQRLRDVRPSGSGSSLRRSAALDERLREPSERLLRAMRWHGPVMLEFRDDGEHAPWLIEVNGRFWGSLQLAIASGVDFPTLWVKILRGERVHPNGGYNEGTTLRWLWGDVKRFLHILRGAPTGHVGSYPSVREGLRELFGTQPAGARLEIWDRRDPWPAVGEWYQGFAEWREWRRQEQPDGRSAHAAPHAAVAAEEL